MTTRIGLLCMACVICAASIGCQGGMPPRRSMVASEPGLEIEGESSAALAAGGGSGFQTNVVDRHPLFSKPREYYENSGDNKIVKTAAATVIGIPAGVVGEIRQIFVGQPSTRR
ncbi:MAG: hypothetical protein SFX72_09210 [Isosphaeraceae bacterium]|nr:hypothetical protein [Isosphaeraceae bacterium]